MCKHDYGDDAKKCKTCGAEKPHTMTDVSIFIPSFMGTDTTRDVEILETGTHNGVAFTESDLDEMVANHAALAAYIKPPLKLGHDDAQILRGQKDGDPALGWVSRLQRVGSKLVATLANVPERLVDLMEKRRYRRVSSEVTLAFDQTGWEKNLQSGVRGKVLTGLALLGADLPAVATLDDLATLLASDTGKPLVIDGPDVVTFAVVASDPAQSHAIHRDVPEANKGEDRSTMDDAKVAELQAALDAAKAEHASAMATLTAETERLRAEGAAAKERAELAARQQVALEADAYVDSMSRTGCLKLTTPESKAHVRALYLKLSDAPGVDADEAVVLKLTDKPLAMSALDVLKGLVAALPDQSTLVTPLASPKAGTGTEVDDELALVAKKHSLDLSDTAQRAKAITLYAAQSPRDRAIARNLGVRAE